jgi:flagellin
VTIRQTHRRLALEIGRGSDGASAAGPSVESAVDVTRAAARSAQGVQSPDAIVNAAGVGSPAIAARPAGVRVDTVALEVKGIIDQMRQIAHRGMGESIGDAERIVLQDEFSLLRSEVDRVIETAGPRRRGHSESLGGHGAGLDDTQEAKSLLDGLSTSRLGLDAGSIGVETAVEAEWALFRLDAADEAVNDIRDEIGTVEERIDAALDRLADFIDSFVPARTRIQSPDEALRAAEALSLQLMHGDGVGRVSEATKLQKSVNALLQ